MLRRAHASLKAPALMLMVLCGLGFRGEGATNNEPSSALQTNAVTSTNTVATNAQPRDLVAARFLTTCAGCHSLTGAKLTGPELSPATAWPLDQLRVGIKKMESKVGPIPDPVVAELADLLKAPDVRDRLKAEGQRIAAMFMAKMEPANPVLGRDLFRGTVPLQNGGLACISCHRVQGQGGNLGLPLDGVFAKTGGELPLVSAIENANFKVMLAHYKRHPVTKQEAMHLASYFGSLNPQQQPAPQNPLLAFPPIGAGLALAGLAGITIVLRKQRSQRRRGIRLQRRRK